MTSFQNDRLFALMKNKVAGFICCVTGIFCNQFIIERFSSDGKISSFPLQIGILLMQILLIAAGVLYFSRAYRWLTRLGVVFLSLFLVQFWGRLLVELPFPEQRMFAALPLQASLFEDGRNYRDQISRYEARFLELTPDLPRTGRIGFMTAPDIDPNLSQFYRGLAGYALLPLNLVKTPQTITIGYALTPEQFASIRETLPDFRVVKQTSDGIAIFQREEKP